MDPTRPPPIPRVDKMPPTVRRVTVALVALWLVLVAGLGGWLSQRAVVSWLERLAASTEYESETTARVVDRLFTQMVSVANMVASQGQVIELAARYRTDPPGFDALTRQQRAAQLTRDAGVRKVGDFMNALGNDLQYARIYMNNLSDDTVTASNWAEPDSIVGMVYSGRTYLVDALRHGGGHSFGIARLNKSPSYFVSSRIESPDHAPLGSVTVRFDASEMALYLTGRHIALIVNRQGRVTTASSKKFMLRNVAALLAPGTVRTSKDGEEPGDPMDLRALTALSSADRWLIDGKPHLLQRRPLANTDYQLCTLAPLDELPPMRQRHLLTALLVGAVGLVLILLSSRVAGQMVARRQDERRVARQTALLNAELSSALTDAQDKDRQKVEVLGYIGHDLRAPLATISGYSALLLSDAQGQQSQLLHTIQRSIKYQLDLIDELMTYAKGELQPLHIQPVATDLPGLLRDVSDYATALCTPQNNSFTFQPSGPAPRQIDIDGKRLQQVLLNLISNAAKFTHNGRVTLTIETEWTEDGCTLNFAVRDTGIGIDLNQKTDIFGAFQNVRAAGGGTGLGLFIAQRIVSAMGGSLHVNSILGQGSIFSFVLFAPVIDASESEWATGIPLDVHLSNPPSKFVLSENSWPERKAMDELAKLALNGRFTDIERWIEGHASEPQHAPFVEILNDLLQQFDFVEIHALALQGLNQITRHPQ